MNELSNMLTKEQIEEAKNIAIHSSEGVLIDDLIATLEAAQANIKLLEDELHNDLRDSAEVIGKLQSSLVTSQQEVERLRAAIQLDPQAAKILLAQAYKTENDDLRSDLTASQKREELANENYKILSKIFISTVADWKQKARKMAVYVAGECPAGEYRDEASSILAVLTQEEK